MRLSSIITIYDVLKAERGRLGDALKLAEKTIDEAAKAAPADQPLMDYGPFATAKAIRNKVWSDYNAVEEAITDLETHRWN